MSRNLTNKDLAKMNKKLRGSFFGADILRTDLTDAELEELTNILDRI